MARDPRAGLVLSEVGDAPLHTICGDGIHVGNAAEHVRTVGVLVLVLDAFIESSALQAEAGVAILSSSAGCSG